MSFDIDQYANRKDTRKRFKLIYEALPESSKTILDIGCARYESEVRIQNDLHKLLVNETEASVKGIDVETAAVERMKEQGYDVAVADAQTFEFDYPFDAIIAGEVIEYLPNPGAFLDKALDHLTSNGRIIFTTENPYAFSVWRKSLHNNFQPNSVWIDPNNIATLSDRITRTNVDVVWLSPDGGISSLLWKLGWKESAAPRYCGIIEK